MFALTDARSGNPTRNMCGFDWRCWNISPWIQASYPHGAAAQAPALRPQPIPGEPSSESSSRNADKNLLYPRRVFKTASPT